MKGLTLAVLLICVAALGFFVYFEFKSPTGVQVKSGNDDIIAYVGLATAIISLIASLISLLEKLRK